MIFSSMLHIPLENKIGEKTIQYNNQIKVECGEGRPAVIEHKKEKDKDQVIKKLKKLLRKTQKSADKKEYSHRSIADRTLYVVFLRFRGCSFTLTLRQRPKGVTRMSCNSTLSARNSFASGLL